MPAGAPDVIKMTVWLKDRSQRPAVNKGWLEMFPDEHSRPARHTFAAPDLPGAMLVQCEIYAVIGDTSAPAEGSVVRGKE